MKKIGLVRDQKGLVIASYDLVAHEGEVPVQPEAEVEEGMKLEELEVSHSYTIRLDAFYERLAKKPRS
ncbi:MAG: hypothetical protein KC547_17870 [Anaerolineae bacterium]|nr:hypothetical protein [Anaerolineae bacterium]